MNITVIVDPPFEPVTLAEVYKQLRLDPDHAGSPDETSHPDDSLLRAQIKTQREFVEKATRRTLIEQTLRLSTSAFPRYCYGWAPPFRSGMAERLLLRHPPFIRLERVQFWDVDNTLQTVDPADYYVTDDLIPELLFASGFAPAGTYARPDAVRVEYVAGYAPTGSPAQTQEEYAGNVPASLKSAILIGVQLQYDSMSPLDREATEKMRESLIQPFRIQNL